MDQLAVEAALFADAADLEASEREEEDNTLPRLAQVLERLPPGLCHILRSRLAGERERSIAKRLGVSRHTIRQSLAEALGRLAIAMDHAETIRADLRPFALRLWRDEVPLMKVAKELKLSRDEAYIRYRELVRTQRGAVAALGRSLVNREGEGT
jgi:hypothetical protein